MIQGGWYYVFKNTKSYPQADNINLPRERNVIELGHKFSSSNGRGVGEVAVNGTGCTDVQVEEGCNIAVGGWASKATASITSLGNARACACACVKSAATLLAVRVLGTRLEDGGLCVAGGSSRGG